MAAGGTELPNGRRPRSRCAARVGLGLAWIAGACTAPTLDVSARPDDARVVVDGRQRDAEAFPADAPYYGTYDLLAVEPLRAPGPDEPQPGTVRSRLTIDEPFSPWLFPVDFVLEVITQDWTATPRHATRLEIEPSVPPEDDDAERDALRARARAMAIRR